MSNQNSGSTYNPLYFLAALGAGGLAVSFFMYPMFLIKHPDTPMATFDYIMPVFQGNDPVIKIAMGIDLLLMIFFAVLHLLLLGWNFAKYSKFRQTEEFTKLCNSNAEVSLMAIPLTLAMTINVMFVLGAVFVPHLWTVVEWLFPFAILGFLAVGIYALRILGVYFTRLVAHGDFDFGSNNNLSQVLAIFALTMVAVGFAAPGAMSHQIYVNAIGIFLSIFFLSIAAFLLLIKLVLGFQSMMQHGISEKASPSLWIMIPVLTLAGISMIRMTFGLHHGFHSELSKPGLFVLTSVILSMEVAVGLIGYAVMKRLSYFKDYVNGPKADAGSFSLICPGVAFFVFGFFFVTYGLVKNGLVEHLSPAFFMILSPFVLVQIITIQVFFKLNCRALSFGLCRIRPVPAVEGKG